MIVRPHRLWRILLKIAIVAGLIAFFGMIAVAMLIAALVIGVLTSLLLPHSQKNHGGSPGFLKGLASQVVGFMLIRGLFSQRPMIPTCDYRLRDAAGQEHLIRVHGYLRSGGMSIGDEIAAEGIDRHGTLLMRRGWNKRLGIAIHVKDT
jgi:hypothetical protein